MSTTRTCASPAPWTPPSPTGTRSPSCPRWRAAEDAVRVAGRGGRQHPAGLPADPLAVGGRAAVGQAGAPQPDRLAEGPGGDLDGAAGREGRAAAPGLHDPRADQ